jgi:hypothetical protein
MLHELLPYTPPEWAKPIADKVNYADDMHRKFHVAYECKELSQAIRSMQQRANNEYVAVLAVGTESTRAHCRHRAGFSS